MRTNTGFFESTSAKTASDGLTVRIRLLSAGQGSSGNYQESMLQERGASAFPAGTHLFYNHPSEGERKNHRDVRNIFGKTLTEPEYVESEKALYADAFVFKKDAEFISQIMSDVDLSIEAAGELDDEGNVLLEYSPSNAIALVPVGGRDGKITQLIESHISSNSLITENYDTIENVKQPLNEETLNMTKEELQEILKEAFAAFKAEILENLTPEIDVVETDIKGLVKALGEADLPDEAVDAVLASEKPLETIETFKAVKQAVMESAKAGTKQVRENGTNYNFQESSKTETRNPVGAWTR